MQSGITNEVNVMGDWEQQFRQFLTDACDHYEKSAPTVHAYCDELYTRLDSNPQSVSLYELRKVVYLRDGGEWLQPNYAANYLYHVMTECGQSTSGHAGF